MRARKANEELTQAHGKAPSYAQLARELGVTEEDVIEGAFARYETPVQTAVRRGFHLAETVFAGQARRVTTRIPGPGLLCAEHDVRLLGRQCRAGRDGSSRHADSQVRYPRCHCLFSSIWPVAAGSW